MFRLFASALILTLVLTTTANAQELPKHITVVDTETLPQLESKALIGPQASSTLAEYDFDGVGGSLDPQGWLGVDLWAQTGTYFHIEDFAGLGGNLAPLSGNASYWCGRRANPGDDPASTYAGYGNNWSRDVTSAPQFLQGPGDVNLQYEYNVDLEDFWDSLYVQYRGNSWVWRTLAIHTGLESGLGNVTAPSDSLADMVEFRFILVSDETGSDEDGLYDSAIAVILDDLVITGPGINVSETFEGGQPGDTTTASGWQSQVSDEFGNYAGLVVGSEVLQEDPGHINDTGMWSFIQGSPDLCADYGAQAVVPNGRDFRSDLASDYISNFIESPEIDLSSDINGDPLVASDGTVTITYDVYQDLEFAASVVFGVKVRYRVNGALTPWDYGGFVYYNATKTWNNRSRETTPPNGATHIQIAMICQDQCRSNQACDGTTCHSHSPLYDNIKVEILKTPIIVTSNADSGPGSLRDAINQANLLPDHDRIIFDIQGSSIIQPLNTLPFLNSPVDIDATTQNGYGNEPVVELNGEFYGNQTAAFSLRDSCAIRGFAIYGFPENGIYIYGDGNVIEACHVGRSPSSEDSPGNGKYGILIADGTLNSRLGGTMQGQGNVITSHPQRGVVVHGFGHAIRGNSIVNNGLIGIDLGENLITGNDFQDADLGPNGQQNFPSIIMVDAAAGTIEAELYSKPNQRYEVDLFVGTNCAPVGHGEGQTFLGSQIIETNDRGHGLLRFSTSSTLVPGRYITATATDSDNNTSEFSTCFEIPPAYVVTTTIDNVAGSLRAAITAANSDGLPSVVSFDLPTTNVSTFLFTTSLPPLTEAVVIDGYSQPGATQNTLSVNEGLNANILLTLNGSQITADGLFILAENCRIQGLNITGFNGNGIRIEAGYAQVWGCFIGVSANGLNSHSNQLAGVRVNNFPSQALQIDIGGEYPSRRNLISANDGAGIVVLNSGVNIRGNLIGTDVTGLAALGNGTGIEANTGAGTGMLVGGSPLYDRNVISGNTLIGVQLSSDGASLLNNHIGVGADGTTPLGNGTFGVFVSGNDNLITAFTGTTSNVIAHNGFDGVRLLAGTGNIVRGSLIHDNGQLGIDVEADGVTTAPAAFAEAPIITGVDIVQNQIYARFSAAENVEVRVQFFANTTCDPSGYGEGEIYLGETMVTMAPKKSSTAFTFDSPIDLSEGLFLSATVEDPALGTSEFSLCFSSTNTPAGSNVAVNLGPIGSEAALTFDNVTTTGSTTASTSASGPIDDGNFGFGNPAEYWDISTTATFTGLVEVCFPYNFTTFNGSETDLVLLHWDETLNPPAWVDITTRIDTKGNEICGDTSHFSPFVVATTAYVSGVTAVVPTALTLRGAAPNPFNPMTTIHYEVPATSRSVSLKIYNLQGHLVRTLVDGFKPAGQHQAVWQGRDDDNQSVASGVYFVRISDGREQVVRKIVLVE